MKNRDRLFTILYLFTLLALAVIPIASPAVAATASRLVTAHVNEDYFYVYDFESESVSRTNVDWPITLIFIGGAEVDKIKAGLDPIFPVKHPFASRHEEYINNGNGWMWDQDGGRKQAACESSDMHEITHYRLYAPHDDQFYNRSWKFYVIGSTHIDTNECYGGPGLVSSGPQWFGQSETAEDKVAFWSKVVWGPATVATDAKWLNNREGEPKVRKEGSHFWKNNGYATYIAIPN